MVRTSKPLECKAKIQIQRRQENEAHDSVQQDEKNLYLMIQRMANIDSMFIYIYKAISIRHSL